MPRSSASLTIAVLGTAGSYHHQVATTLFPRARLYYFASFGEVVGAVASGGLQKGIVAIANSTIGDLAAPQDLLRRYAHQLTTEGQYTLPIQHCLVVAAAGSSTPLTTIYSHSAALQQCKGMITARGWQCRAVSDTATAVRQIMAHPHPHHAAIASPFAARLYGAHVLPDVVQDAADNATTFVVISSEFAPMKLACP